MCIVWNLCSGSICVLWPHSVPEAGRASEGTTGRDICFRVLSCISRRSNKDAEEHRYGT